MTPSRFNFRFWIARKMYYPKDLRGSALIIFNNPKNVIMQSTGLTDINGKEIYEGDLVSYPSWRDDSPRETVIKWESNQGEPECCTYGFWVPDKSEVVNNIYEGNK